MSVDLHPSGNAATRGWGQGWPACTARAEIVALTWSNGVALVGGMHRNIAALVRLLGNETIRRGYRPYSPGCWGFDCRPIAGTTIASNHSWGLAADINAPSNPRTYGLHTDMPGWMPTLWNAYGFRWGGDYPDATKDPMHYEFMGDLAQAQQMTARAQQAFGTPPTQPLPPPVLPGGTMFMYLRAAGPMAGSAIVVADGKQVRCSPAHANKFSSDGVPYANTPDAVQETIYDKAYGPPVT